MFSGVFVPVLSTAPPSTYAYAPGETTRDRVGVSFYKKYQATTFSHPQFVGMYTVGFSYCIDAEMSFRLGLLRLARSFRFGLSHLAWVLCHLGPLFHV